MADNEVAAPVNLLNTVWAVAPNFKRGLEFLELSSRPFKRGLKIFAYNQYLWMAVIGPDNSVLSWVVHHTLQSVPLPVHVTQMDVAELTKEVENIRRDNQLYIEFHVNQNHPNMQEYVVDCARNTLTIYKHGHLGQPINLYSNLQPPRQWIRFNTTALRFQLQQIFGTFNNHAWDFQLNALHLVTLTARQSGSLEITSLVKNEVHTSDQKFEHSGKPLDQDVSIIYRLQSLKCLAEYGAQIQQPKTYLMLTPPFELFVDNAVVFPNVPAFTTNQIFVPIPPQR